MHMTENQLHCEERYRREWLALHQVLAGSCILQLSAVADLEIQKGGFREARSQSFGLPRPLPVTLAVELNNSGVVKCLEISKELICECVTMPGCCCCMLLLRNHLMDS